MRIGVIGAGFIGRTHIRCAASMPELELIGYVDPMASADHPDLKGLPSFASVAALLEVRPDGVVVAVPDDLHVPVATQCLAGGAAVLLEKPAAPSLAECVELAGAAPDIAKRLLVGHHRRHHPATRMTMDLIASGRLGKLIGVSGVYAVRKDDNYFAQRPRGVGLVNLIHDLDLLQHYCGRIDYVTAAVSHAARGAAEEDTIAVLMEFGSGVVGTFVATDSSPSPWGWDQATTELPSMPYHPAGSTYSLLGTAASLAIPDLRLYAHNAGEAWHHPLVSAQFAIPEENAYVNQLRHFAEMIRGAVKPIVGIGEALHTQAALEAVFVSGRERRRVSTRELIETAGRAAGG